jgi:hypothetical protein
MKLNSGFQFFPAVPYALCPELNAMPGRLDRTGDIMINGIRKKGVPPWNRKDPHARRP